MKKIIRLFALILTVLGATGGAATLYAQNAAGFSLWGGAEANGYSPTSAGFGGRIGEDYRFGEQFSFGSSFLLSSDGDFTTLEFSANLRYYLFRNESSLIKHYNWAAVFHFFVQAEGGAGIFITEDNTPQALLMGGLAIGSRIALGRLSSFYIEPYARIGYPYILGVGVLGVYRFPVKGGTW
ncbi:MAG: hypothetical protein LBK61_05260 [Spirochaetaceae bacterium]|jgi:hypothetical protein|nr:hypothetical protein [Spirochaetaceae bacterium]